MEELHAGICGETWWNSSKTMFTCYSSSCSTGIAVDMGRFGWSTVDMVDMKVRSSYDESKDSMAFQLEAQQADSDSCGSSILIDSTLKMMGFGLPLSTTSDWNQSLIRQEPCMDSSQIQKDWSPGEDSCITTFKPINHDFSSEDQRLNSVTSSGNTNLLVILKCYLSYG